MVGDGGENLVQLGEQPRLVRRLDDGLILERDEGVARGERRGQADLEAATGGDGALLRELLERCVGSSGRIGIAERAEGDGGPALALAQPRTWLHHVLVRAGRRYLELRVVREH